MMKSAYLFVILAIALVSSFPIESGDSCCGTEGFDSSRQTCCGTRIHTIRDGFTCCGNDYFDPNAAGRICCVTAFGEFLSTVSANVVNPQCCGRRGFDAATQVCCSEDSSSVVSLPNAVGSFSCCGTNSVFNTETQLCCESRVVSFPSSTTGNFQCCGTSLVNLETQACCNNNVRTLDSNPNTQQECCGSQLHDVLTQRCCSGITASGVFATVGNENLECCGSTLFDPTTHTCCENTRAVEGFGSCCGTNSLYSEEFQECCNGRIGCGDACCGNMAYWTDEFTCCQSGGRFQLHRGIEQSCCGTEVYDETEQICCGTTIHKRESCATECCGEQVYDPALATCCETTNENGTVTERELLAGLGTCCRTDVIDEDEDRLFVGPTGVTPSREDPNSRPSREEDESREDDSREDESRSREDDSREDESRSREDDSREDESRSREDESRGDNGSRTNSRKLGLNSRPDESRSRSNKVKHVKQKRVKREVAQDSTRPRMFVLYNPEREVCCAKSLTLSKRSCGDTCCGENGYFANFQQCNCQNTVINDPTRIFNCCGTREFFPDDPEDPEICCSEDGSRSPRVFDFDPQGICCGNDYITSNQNNVVCCFV